MRSATVSFILLWAACALAGQVDSSSENGSPIGEKSPRASILLTKGMRPGDPGSIRYREHWGGFWGSVHSVAFSPDGRYLLSAGLEGGGGTVRLWDAETGEELRRYQGKGHSSHYASVAFSPDGKYVLAGSYKNTGSDPHAAWLWDIDTTIEVQRYVGHTTHYVGGVQVGFSPDGKSVVTACLDGPALVWDTATGSIAKRLGTGQGVNAAAFSPDGTRIVTGADAGAVTIWEADSGNQIRMFFVDGDVKWVVFSPDGHRLLVRNRKAVCYLDITSGQVIHRFSAGLGTYASALSPDGAFALIGVEYLDRSHGGLKGEGRAELYDLSTGKKLKAFEQKQAYDGPITAAAFSPDGRFAATGSSCGPIRLWEVKTGEQVRGFYGHLGKGPDISFIGDDLVQIDSWIGPLEHFDERQRQWLDRIRRQQELTVDVSQIPSFPWHHQHESP